MKKLFIAAFAALTLAGCNTKLGPESETYAAFASVTCPETVTPTQKARIVAVVTSTYGLQLIGISYYLDEENSDVKSVLPTYYTSTGQVTQRYEGYIPEQKAGTKVTLQIQALTHYGLLSGSEVYSYTVEGEPAAPAQ